LALVSSGVGWSVHSEPRTAAVEQQWRRRRRRGSSTIEQERDEVEEESNTSEHVIDCTAMRSTAGESCVKR